MSDQLVNLLVGLGAGGLAAAVAAIRSRHKDKADAADVITQAAERVLRQMQARSDRVESDLEDLREKLEREVSALSRAVHDLTALVVSLGGDPTAVIRALDVARRPPRREVS